MDAYVLDANYLKEEITQKNEAILIHQLCGLRRQTATEWDVCCEELSYKIPAAINNSISVYLRYPAFVEPETKSDTTLALKALGIELGILFVCNRHPVQSSVPDCPNPDTAVRQCINIPRVLS